MYFVTVKTWATRQGEVNSRAIMRKDELFSSPEITVQNVRTEKKVSEHAVLLLILEMRKLRSRKVK